MKTLFLLAIILVLNTVTACTTSIFGESAESSYPLDAEDTRRARRGKVGGEDGLFSLGGGSDKPTGGATLGVNSYLWRATLDTLSFVPLASVDPRGGVIITDWYEDPEAPGERFKINAIILDTRLRSDGVRLSLFRQKLDTKTNMWRDVKANAEVASKLEDTVLTRARELRVADAG